MGKSNLAVEREAQATTPPSPEPANTKVGEEIDAQIRRLRQILTLMAPEAGTAALGSSRRTTSHMPITERVRLLTEYRR